MEQTVLNDRDSVGKFTFYVGIFAGYLHMVWKEKGEKIPFEIGLSSNYLVLARILLCINCCKIIYFTLLSFGGIQNLVCQPMGALDS